MAKIAWKGGALLAPVPPVMVSCGTMEHPNIITVAWTGLINTQPPRLSISVRPGRYSYHLIRESGEFVVNLTPTRLIRAADLCGMYTGAKVDKFRKAQLTPEPAQSVACPLIAECPLSLECRVTDVLPQGTHDLFLADIVAVDVDESVLDGTGVCALIKQSLLRLLTANTSRLAGASASSECLLHGVTSKSHEKSQKVDQILFTFSQGYAIL